VLSERDAENQATITQQKRKVSRQRDLLLALKERAAKQDSERAAENCRLTEEYRRVTEQFKELQVRRWAACVVCVWACGGC
jgi:dynein regulatory complex protein 1